MRPIPLALLALALGLGCASPPDYSNRVWVPDGATLPFEQARGHCAAEYVPMQNVPANAVDEAILRFIFCMNGYGWYSVEKSELGGSYSTQTD